MIKICPIIDNMNFDHFVKGVSVSSLHYDVATLPFNKCFVENTLKLCEFPFLIKPEHTIFASIYSCLNQALL